MKRKVICTFEVEIDVPDNIFEGDLKFDIEEMNCPITGKVGAIVLKAIKDAGDDFCWCCNLKGKNKLVDK